MVIHSSSNSSSSSSSSKTTTTASGSGGGDQNKAAAPNESLHFIKWIQQDGFIYMTINLEEIYLHVNIGYCTRYRTSMPKMIRFFSQEFHVYSFTYDYHLSAINRNLTSASWMVRSQITQIISKFLDEFHSYYVRHPLYSINKVFKLINEKRDSSFIQNFYLQQQQQYQTSSLTANVSQLRQQQQKQCQSFHKFGFIFDYISAKSKLKSANSNLSFFPLDVGNVDNKTAIYSLNDTQNATNVLDNEYLKYLVIRIDNLFKTSETSYETTTVAHNNNSYT